MTRNSVRSAQVPMHSKHVLFLSLCYKKMVTVKYHLNPFPSVTRQVYGKNPMQEHASNSPGYIKFSHTVPLYLIPLEAVASSLQKLQAHLQALLPAFALPKRRDAHLQGNWSNHEL